MDKDEKKRRLAQWKERRPEMGVVCLECGQTGERFLSVTRDTATAFNRHRFQLSAGLHPSGRLQALWDSCGGEAGFTCRVVSTLKYERPEEVRPEDLEELLELCLLEDPGAQRL